LICECFVTDNLKCILKYYDNIITIMACKRLYKNFKIVYYYVLLNMSYDQPKLIYSSFFSEHKKKMILQICNYLCKEKMFLLNQKYLFCFIKKKTNLNNIHF